MMNEPTEPKDEESIRTELETIDTRVASILDYLNTLDEIAEKVKPRPGEDEAREGYGEPESLYHQAVMIQSKLNDAECQLENTISHLKASLL